MGNKLNKSKTKLKKHEFEIMCDQLAHHLMVERNRILEAISVKEMKLRKSIAEGNKTEKSLLIDIANVMADFKFIIAINILSRYCSTLKGYSLKITDAVNKGRPDALRELEPYIQGILYSASRVGISAVQDFSNFMKTNFSIELVKELLRFDKVGDELKDCLDLQEPGPAEMIEYLQSFAESQRIRSIDPKPNANFNTQEMIVKHKETNGSLVSQKLSNSYRLYSKTYDSNEDPALINEQEDKMDTNNLPQPSGFTFQDGVHPQSYTDHKESMITRGVKHPSIDFSNHLSQLPNYPLPGSLHQIDSRISANKFGTRSEQLIANDYLNNMVASNLNRTNFSQFIQQDKQVNEINSTIGYKSDRGEPKGGPDLNDLYAKLKEISVSLSLCKSERLENRSHNQFSKIDKGHKSEFIVGIGLDEPL